MKIGVISLISDVHNPSAVAGNSNTILSLLKQSFEIEEINISEIHRVDIPIVFIVTGGTEHKFKKIFPGLLHSGKPITLLSTGSHNSLPACLEILYWIDKQGIKNTLLLHGSIDSIKEKMEKRCHHIEIAEKLKKMNIGVIGKPSDWLISSDVNYDNVHKKWGITFTFIELHEVLENMNIFSPIDIKETLLKFPPAGYINGPGEKDILEAAKIYLALKKIVSDYRLSSLTLRCFDLLKPLNNTGCLALSRLNDEGIPAGCEGDIPALFTMIINRLITGNPAFMANPSQIHDDGIIFAHCTVPTSMVQSFGYETHFESGIGIGVAGTFAPGPVTISKINGDDLDHYYAAAGNITTFNASHNFCRTQVKVKILQGYDYFFKFPLGNHHIISSGNHLTMFHELMNFFSVREKSAR